MVHSSRGHRPSISHVSRAARMSIIYSILRVANPQGVLRWIVYGIITCFAIMWIALVVGKVLHCEHSQCNMGSDVAIALLISE